MNKILIFYEPNSRRIRVTLIFHNVYGKSLFIVKKYIYPFPLRQFTHFMMT